MRRLSALCVLLIAGAVLGACSSNKAAAPASPTGTGTALPTPSASPPSVVTATATLAHVPTGTVTMQWSATTRELTVTVTMTGLGPNSTHPAHIHSGTCANTGGVLYPLNPVVADASGDATATTTVSPVANGIPATGWAVNVHTGPGLTPADQYRSIGCVDVANPSHADSFTGSLLPQPGPGNDVTGTATVVLDTVAHTLGVSLTVQGLDPNTEHPAHIHLGSCEFQGPVIFPLPDLKSDASGSASVTATFTGVTATAIPAPGPETAPSVTPTTTPSVTATASAAAMPPVTVTPSVTATGYGATSTATASVPGWYVNVHNTTALTTQVGFTPLSCGDVMVSP
jgi:hypothetical protein